MKALRKPLSLFMAMLMCLGIFAGTGTTAFAAGETMTTYMVEFPRASDPNKAGWGHSAMNFLGGWSTGENNGFTIHTQDSFNGKVIYCIEPGVSVHSGDQFTGRGEDFWDDYPSDLNPTIPPDTIKEYIGRIMTYGWQGNASTSWMTDDPEDASKMAGAIATQLLVWETVVGERDSQFNHVDANAQGKNNIAEYTSPENPLYSEIFSQYSAIESAVKRHTMLPSFFSSTADAGAYELKWDGQQYSLTLTDTNGVLGDYTFTSNITGLNFSVDGNQLTITSSQAIKGSVTVKAEKISAQRSGVVVWTDGIIGGGKQDFATYGETVSDYMVGYLNLEVKTGNMKLVKTSEDGQVAGISFTITGEGYSATKTTNEAGEIDISDLNPGVYTVTEQSIDKYEPQESQRVTIVSGQTATVTFSNVLKRGSLEVTKTSEDGLVEGMTFHLYGTSLSGQPVDEYAVTDGNGVARFENVLIGTGYVLEEVDTPIRYVVPDSQTATIEWNEVTHKSVNNVLKKFRVTVTKSDVETGAPQGDGSLAGATYGLYKGDTLIDSYTTDENGQFTTGYYVCDSDWTIREINPSEGYLLDSSIHKVGAEPELYEIELNDTANDVTEQVIKGATLLAKCFGVDKVYIGIEANKQNAADVLNAKIAELNAPVVVEVLHTRYPQGAEKQLVQAVSGRQVPSGKLPADAGCCIFNLNTTCAIYRAVYEGMPVVNKIVTVSGSGVIEPKNIECPIGTPITKLFDACGGLKDETYKLIMGGPMMGLAQYDVDVSVGKGTGAMLAFADKEEQYVEDPQCIRCGKCVGVCPIRLEPIFMYKYLMKGDVDTWQNVLHGMDCIECGACTYTCPARLPLTHAFRLGKQEVNNARMAAKVKAEAEAKAAAEKKEA